MQCSERLREVNSIFTENIGFCGPFCIGFIWGPLGALTLLNLKKGLFYVAKSALLHKNTNTPIFERSYFPIKSCIKWKIRWYTFMGRLIVGKNAKKSKSILTGVPTIVERSFLLWLDKILFWDSTLSREVNYRISSNRGRPLLKAAL